MTRGLGRIPRIRGTLRQARDGMPARRYPPAPPGPAAHDTTATPAAAATGTGGPPGHRNPGLAPGVLGWPWHPRRLATARYRSDTAA